MNYAVCTDNQIAEGDLNALFKTLYIGAGGTVFVGGNPGEKECDRNIAESRGWKVRLRY